MKLSCGVPVFHIWEDRVKAHLVLCLSTSLFTVLTVHCGGCFVSGAFILSLFLQFSCSFFVFICIDSLCAFLPLTNYFRNPNLNASCCGFLQKLSMCLLSQSDPASGTYQHGMQIRTHTCTTHRATCSTSKTPLFLSVSKHWCHASSYLRLLKFRTVDTVQHFHFVLCKEGQVSCWNHFCAIAKIQFSE